MTGPENRASSSMNGATNNAIPSARCRARRFGDSSLRTRAKYEMTNVMPIRATASAAAWESPQRWSTGVTCALIVLAPKAADRKPATVTPICTAARNREGCR